MYKKIDSTLYKIQLYRHARQILFLLRLIILFAIKIQS